MMILYLVYPLIQIFPIIIYVLLILTYAAKSYCLFVVFSLRKQKKTIKVTPRPLKTFSMKSWLKPARRGLDKKLNII